MELFKRKNCPYNLSNTQLLELSKCKTKIYGLNTAMFKGSLLWKKNCQMILRKQNPYNISKTNLEMDREIMYLLYVLK